MTPRDRSIASLTAKGLTQERVPLLGISCKTVQRALANREVRALADQLEGSVDEPAVATLRSALLATRRDGSPGLERPRRRCSRPTRGARRP